ncbi:MAG: PRC-barrel domain-containing protein, partial [Micrococcales bacterium]|nr:PRC-barrel domain-containing protein [Micrococcales bacterium]
MTGNFLSTLVKNPVLDKAGSDVGRLQDVIVQLEGADLPLVTAIVVRFGRSDVFVPAADIRSIDDGRVTLSTSRVDVRPFSRRPGEVLLRHDVLGHRVVDIEQAMLVRARDVSLERDGDTIRVAGLDVRRRRLFRSAPPSARDWHDFSVLIGHQASATLRRPFSQLRKLKPAQVADLIESASPAERDELLTEVASDPDFEADVLEELDEDEANRVLRDQSVADIADALAHMQTDDAADALLGLPQERRQAVLDAVAAPKRVEILELLGYREDSAGGLMGNDEFSLPATTTVAAALDRVRAETERQPQSLAVIFTLDDDGRLMGTVSLLRLVQADPAATLADIH